MTIHRLLELLTDHSIGFRLCYNHRTRYTQISNAARDIIWEGDLNELEQDEFFSNILSDLVEVE